MEATLSNDFLGNLAQLTQSLKSMSSVDLTGIDEVPDSELNEEMNEEMGEELNKFGKKKDNLHENFKIDVKELAQLEDKLKEYAALIKKLKDKKEEIKKRTIEHMIKYNIDIAQMSENDKYSLMTVKRKVNPATKKKLPERISEYFITEDNMNETKAKKKSKEMVEWIYNTTEVTTDQSLRRYRK